MTQDRILITGATGYIGGLLLRVLEQTGRPLRCLVRRRGSLRDDPAPATEVVQGDVFDPGPLTSALEGVHTAYYLIHSMGSDGEFEAQDREAALNFARAARACGVRRIIYLGGLGQKEEGLSPHLRSRHETGETLRASGVPVIELRASIVLGSGSLSFELIRALVERLPVMVCPRWVHVKAQPIAIEDVVAYLVGSIDLPADGSKVFEIGGADQVSYADIMREYARQPLPIPLEAVRRHCVTWKQHSPNQ